MAKQSGLHQIRGKVGEYSYYRQTGVSGGLIRGINQGLSARVKNGDEYVNTRLNNAEFGAACRVAACLGRMVEPKFRPMVLPFSQSKMSKLVLELAKESSAPWGQRCVPADSAELLAGILNGTSKRNPDEFGTISVEAGATTDQFVAHFAFNEYQATNMVSLGISGVIVSVASYRLGTGKYIELERRFAASRLFKVGTWQDARLIESGSDDDIEVNFAVSPWLQPSTNVNPYEMVTVVLMPYRIVGDNHFVLQEYCSFKSFKLPRPQE